MRYTGQISLTDRFYLPSYSVKCISCFMLRHLRCHEICKFKILNKKQTSKNVADTTFKVRLSDGRILIDLYVKSTERP